MGDVVIQRNRSVEVELQRGPYRVEVGGQGPQGRQGLPGGGLDDVDAFGTFAERDGYDDESAGFVYLSTDGDGDSIADSVFFVKASNASGDWAGPITLLRRVALGVTINDKPLPDEVLIRYRPASDEVITFAADFAPGVAGFEIAATAETVFNINKNGSLVGTITVAISGTEGTLAGESMSAVVLSGPDGDVLELVAPSSPDATLADGVINLIASR